MTWFLVVCLLIFKKISFGSLSTWSTKKSNNSLILVYNPSNMHTVTCVSAEIIIAHVWKIYVNTVPLCLPHILLEETQQCLCSSPHNIYLLLYPHWPEHTWEPCINGACNHFICISLKVNNSVPKPAVEVCSVFRALLSSIVIFLDTD